ncbi:MAG: chemotaxis protein CheW [Halobacteriovoraceae bacterium]|nr:chemotaxis protein CheW [Halobacteriovoraceae bacterium]
MNEQENNLKQLKIKKYLEVSILDKKYCIPLKDVREVVPRFEISTVPLTPKYFKGLINLRGRILSVIDLGHRLNYKDIEVVPKMTCIVIVSIGGIEIGVLVEEVLCVCSIEDKDIEEVSTNDKNNEFITGIIKTDNSGELRFLIDLSKALDIKIIQSMMLSNATGT